MASKKYNKEEIKRLSEQGHSYTQITQMIGCSRATVQLHCGKRKQLNVSCVICGKMFYRRPSVKNSHNACSIACRNKWFSKEKHPRWKGGKNSWNRKNDRLRVYDNKVRAVELMGGRCELCGYDKCVAALDFHHKNPLEKDSQLKDLMHCKWEIILSELQKCILVCSNCHREHHWLERHPTLKEF